jgi:hypothetical protein
MPTSTLQRAIPVLLLSGVLLAADKKPKANGSDQAAPRVFQHAEYLWTAEGKQKPKNVRGNLIVNPISKTVAFEGRSAKVNLEIKAASMTSAVYERNATPRIAAGLLLAWPLIFTKEKKHFLTIQYKESDQGKYAIFRLDKDNYREILAIIEPTTGMKVERAEER